jgi:hypothetical protein
MRRPYKTFPNSPGQIRKLTPDNLPDPSLDPKAFEDLIKNRGIRWKHEKATPCPNVSDIEQQMHDPNCRICENGMLFYGSSEIHGIFSNNKLERMYEVIGIWDVGQAIVTFSAYMDGQDGTPGMGTAIDMQHWDKLTCLDYEFRWQERIEHSPTGVDRLRYPALQIEFVATKSKKYFADTHFQINADGNVQWISQEQPSYDQLNQRGEIYTISYTAQPVFYVIQLLHEIRATKAIDHATGLNKAVRLPQQVLIMRDYLFLNRKDKDGLGTTSTPRSGGGITPA